MDTFPNEEFPSQLSEVDSIQNLDTARMTLRWMLERLDALGKAKAELEGSEEESRLESLFLSAEVLQSKLFAAMLETYLIEKMLRQAGGEPGAGSIVPAVAGLREEWRKRREELKLEVARLEGSDHERLEKARERLRGLMGMEGRLERWAKAISDDARLHETRDSLLHHIRGLRPLPASGIGPEDEAWEATLQPDDARLHESPDSLSQHIRGLPPLPASGIGPEDEAWEATLQSERRRYQADLEACRKREQELGGKIPAVEQEAAEKRLGEALAELARESERADESEALLRGERERAAGEAAALKGEVERARQELAASQGRVEELSARIPAAEHEAVRDQLTGALAQLSRERERAAGEAAALKGELERARQELAASPGRVEELPASVPAAEHEAAEKRLGEALAELARERERAVREAAALKGEVERARQELAVKAAELESRMREEEQRHRAELERREAEHSRIQAELVAFSRKCIEELKQWEDS